MEQKNEKTTSEIGAKFSQFLKEKRIAKGLSIRKFSILIYGSESQNSYLNDIENGKREPNLKTLSLILDSLNCSIDFIEH